jgi:uncharacterized membrane protein HdeD (DUF308 family)
MHVKENAMVFDRASARAEPGDVFFSPSEAMSEALARNWWVIAIRGFLGIAFGIIALLQPFAAILAFVLVFAAYAVVDGIFAIVAAVRAAREHERWGLLVLAGIASIAAGALAVLWPGITVVAFALLLAAWSIVTGALTIGAAFRLNRQHGRGWLIFGGAVSVIYGILLAIAPIVGAVVLTWWIGAWALVFGVLLLVLAFRLRAHRHDRAPGAFASRPT